VGWWEVGKEWRDERATLGDGDVGPRLAEFAQKRGVVPNTVRKSQAAVDFLLRMRKSRLIDDRQISALAGLPLKSISSLARVARLDRSQLPAALVMAAGGQVRSSDLLHLEETIRDGKLPHDGKNAEERAYRLTSGFFRRMAMDAVETRARAAGHPIVRPRHALFDPLHLDAVELLPGGRGHAGYRPLAAAPDWSTGRRLSDALNFAMAAARVFDEFIVVFDRSHEAEEFAARVEKLGDCGVGVESLRSGGEGLEVWRRSARTQGCDLAGSYRRSFEVLFEPSKDRPGGPRSADGERARIKGGRAT
jgi:hypothetical protein